MALAFVPRPIADLPWRMLWIVAAIATFGVLGLYSAAGGSIMPWAFPHAARFGLFLAMAIGLSYVRPQRFQEYAFAAYGAVFLLLILVELMGRIGGGAQSWLELGPIRIQPSELMKPVLVLVLARFYAAVPPREIRRWSAIWPAALLVGVPTAMILIQPDLGTALLITFSSIVMMYPRRPAAQAVRRRRTRRRGGDADRLLLPAAAPAGAAADLPQSRAGPARRRLPPHPVEDRDRIGRACSARAS